MSGWLFAVTGAAAGIVQAGILARSVGSNPRPLAFLVRYLLVAAVLFLAARAGFLLPAAAGWFAGFAAGVIRRHRSFR